MLGSPVTHSSPIPSASSLSTVEAHGALTCGYQVDHISATNVDSPVSVERAENLDEVSKPGLGLQNQEEGC